MRDDTPMDLAAYRLSQAAEFLQDAEINNNNGALKTAANRSYYCIFHAMRAVLALERSDIPSPTDWPPHINTPPLQILTPPPNRQNV